MMSPLLFRRRELIGRNHREVLASRCHTARRADAVIGRQPDLGLSLPLSLSLPRSLTLSLPPSPFDLVPSVQSRSPSVFSGAGGDRAAVWVDE